MNTTELMEIAHYLVRLRSGYERDAAYFLFQFNQDNISAKRKNFYQLCCETAQLRINRIDRMFDIAETCAEDGTDAGDLMKCIHFFLFNQTDYDAINYQTYRQYSEHAA
jgi:hypothetical protein